MYNTADSGTDVLGMTVQIPLPSCVARICMQSWITRSMSPQSSMELIMAHKKDELLKDHEVVWPDSINLSCILRVHDVMFYLYAIMWLLVVGYVISWCKHVGLFILKFYCVPHNSCMLKLGQVLNKFLQSEIC